MACGPAECSWDACSEADRVMMGWFWEEIALLGENLETCLSTFVCISWFDEVLCKQAFQRFFGKVVAQFLKKMMWKSSDLASWPTVIDPQEQWWQSSDQLLAATILKTRFLQLSGFYARNFFNKHRCHHHRRSEALSNRISRPVFENFTVLPT